MKNRYVQSIFFLISLSSVMAISSCNEDVFLDEIPKDFYSPENAYVTYADFDAAVLNLHRGYRTRFIENDGDLLWSMTELAYPNQGRWDNVQSILIPTNSGEMYNYLWAPLYQIIYDANVIMGRAESESSEMTLEERNKIMAEASFFRGYAHKILANLYGGVPIVLESTKEPKRDYTRASRQEVYEQCVTDLEFAVANLPDVDEVEVSRLNKLAASHVLSEVYISLERWDDAIQAASAVIDH
ncbi:MAG: RagB/SusD family nutrient uptake outer membrane protein, partial [Cyclobacteriaceae bacterium]